MPRLRFTVRRMMALIAVVAILFAGVVASLRRRAEFLTLADRYAFREFVLANLPNGLASDSRTDGSATTARASYYAGLKAKYDRAARYPWLPVCTDPPEPE